ncbi:unnamed protein product [Rotaria sp. Silwood2]|nr:unnamed protein product [Rotaria sp. Silwood2]
MSEYSPIEYIKEDEELPTFLVMSARFYMGLQVDAKRFLVDLPSLALSYLIFSLIPSSQSIHENNLIQTENQFQDFINNLCIITPTNQLPELQQILVEINTIWQNLNTAEHIKTSLDILHIRKHTNEMQLIAYRWKNFYLLNSNNKNQQRQTICEELTTVFFFHFSLPNTKSVIVFFLLLQDQNILSINDSTSTTIIDKMSNLEQTVIQRLRWAAGADPLVQDVFDKFEIRQKELARGVRGAIIKIDIEGSESFVIESGSRVFDTLEIPFIQMEWFKVRDYPDRVKIIIDFFVKRNYDPKTLSCQLLNVNQHITWPNDLCWIKRNVSNFC